ncbi:GtrA family protein [Loktanella sp. Alg231-35]|uniref:GtrA family protein n=1 Tax=Loktanella sp. Alg231-35 TaxID=1922220 RepID=UPI000D550521|nr:GtrA family protein [Loktanella sp. Alg231-35]
MTRTKRTSRFALVGVSIAILYVLLYLTFLQLGMPQGRANALAFVIAVVVQYAGQARFTFGKQLANPTQILRFGVMTGLGFITSALITGYIAPMFALDNWIAAVAVTLILPVQNYILMSLWVFTKSVS